MAGSEDFKREAARLRSIRARMENLRPVLLVAANDLRNLVDDRFETSTGPDGAPWAPLSDETLLARARKAAGPTRVRNTTIGPLREGQSRVRTRRWTRARSERAAAAVNNAKPLIDTARLRQSITTRVTKNEIFVGTNVVYAATHQFGRGYIVDRPFLPFRSTGGESVAIVNAGPAAAFWTRLEALVREYIITGRIG